MKSSFPYREDGVSKRAAVREHLLTGAGTVDVVFDFRLWNPDTKYLSEVIFLGSAVIFKFRDAL